MNGLRKETVKSDAMPTTRAAAVAASSQLAVVKNEPQNSIVKGEFPSPRGNGVHSANEKIAKQDIKR